MRIHQQNKQNRAQALYQSWHIRWESSMGFPTSIGLVIFARRGPIHALPDAIKLSRDTSTDAFMASACLSVASACLAALAARTALFSISLVVCSPLLFISVSCALKISA